ncbi:polysaccharide intercellular adhesin biosynthesis/export protein IcaC [Staphylococcus aureus]|uniref:polysaccharide intercellular adhesin biosynthesis/export protein IcaC n=1 Tax=Staphylococcus aureus TaxID=1280 RepID=UPI0012488139|nr:polysaccharide intercellular adhesin biosynthesis/export protein IcaC [Staphylococcus aureus]
MNKKKTELIYLRAFICILIIVTHLLTQMMNDIDDTEINQLKLLYYVQNIVIFGTPSFIILSQLLTTLNYEKITFKYLWSRFKYIFIPYLTIGLFYCYTESLKLNSPFLHQFYENVVLGYWYGYFIIVILQYFILSYFIYKISSKIFESKVILLISLIIQITFLHLLHNNNEFSENFHAIYPLSDNTFILGWIFFFFLGGYIGKNYNNITAFLRNYLFIILVLAILSFVLFIIMFSHDYWNVTSYTEALIFYHSFMFLLLLGATLHFKEFMFYSINLVNTFSFFVYLLHPIVIDALYENTSVYIDHTFIFLAVSLLFILGLCIGVGIILREFYIFRFVIGKQPYSLKLDLK